MISKRIAPTVNNEIILMTSISQVDCLRGISEKGKILYKKFVEKIEEFLKNIQNLPKSAKNQVIKSIVIIMVFRLYY